VNASRMGWQVCRIAPEATHALRRQVLRDGREDAAVTFPDDGAPGALHVGVWPGGPAGRAQGSGPPVGGTVPGAADELAGSPIGVASFLPAPAPEALLAALAQRSGEPVTGRSSGPAPPLPSPGSDLPGGPGAGPAPDPDTDPDPDPDRSLRLPDRSLRLPDRSFQLRGMAVSPRWQGSGAGSALLRRGLELVEQAGATLVWANGRDPALAFYRRHGFVVLGEGFLGAESVPHHWIARRLGTAR